MFDFSYLTTAASSLQSSLSIAEKVGDQLPVFQCRPFDNHLLSCLSSPGGPCIQPRTIGSGAFATPTPHSRSPFFCLFVCLVGWLLVVGCWLLVVGWWLVGVVVVVVGQLTGGNPVAS